MDKDALYFLVSSILDKKYTVLDTEVFMSPLDLKRKKELTQFAAVCLNACVIFLVALGLITRYFTDHPDNPHNLSLAVVPVVILIAVLVFAPEGMAGVLARLFRRVVGRKTASAPGIVDPVSVGRG